MGRPPKAEPAEMIEEIQSAFDQTLDYLGSDAGIQWLRDFCIWARAYQTLLTMLENPEVQRKDTIAYLKREMRRSGVGRIGVAEAAASGISAQDLATLLTPLRQFGASLEAFPGGDVLGTLNRLASSERTEEYEFYRRVQLLYEDRLRTKRSLSKLVAEHFPAEWQNASSRRALLAKVERAMKKFKEASPTVS